MLVFLSSLLANPLFRKIGIVLLALAVLQLAHCYHDKKLIRDYEADVQARIAEAVAEANEIADERARIRSERFTRGQDDIERAVEGLGEDQAAGEATEAFHRALCVAQGRDDC